MIERVPPNSAEAERAVIGAALLNNEALQLQLAPAHFYRTGHQAIWAGVLSLEADGTPVDLVTLSGRIREIGEMDRVGGMVYLSSLTNEVPTVSNARHWADKIIELHRRRETILAAQDLLVESYAAQSDLNESLGAFDARLAQLSTTGRTERLRELLGPRFNYYEQLYQGNIPPGIPTGYRDLDDRAPIKAPDLVVVAGRTGMGKTGLALGMAKGAAKAGHEVLYFSLEMSRDQLADRLISSESKVDGQKFRRGNFVDADWPKLTEGAGRLSDLPITIDDRGGLTVSEIKATSADHKRKHGLSMIIIDHVLLMGVSGEKNNQAIRQLYQELKTLAKNLDVPVIALAQLNRSVETREPPIPTKSDLREGGEDEADTIFLIYRQDYYEDRLRQIEEASNGRKKLIRPELEHVGRIIMEKNRHGPPAYIDLTWLAAFTTYADIMR